MQTPSNTYWRVQLLCKKDQAHSSLADLPLLRMLLAICQKFSDPSFWEVMDPFALLAYASLEASRTLFQQLLAYLNFTLGSEDLTF